MRSFKKFRFWQVASFFSNSNPADCANKIGCTYRMGFNSGSFIISHMRRMGKYSDILIDYMMKLYKLSAERIDHLSRVDWSMISGIEQEREVSLKLKLDDIAQISIKNMSWFFNNNTKHDIIAYSLDGKDVKFIRSTKASDDILFLKMQDQGYRFIEYWGEEYYNFYLKQVDRTTEMLKESKESLQRSHDRIMELLYGSPQPTEKSEEMPVTFEMTYEELIDMAFNPDSDDRDASAATQALLKVRQAGGDLTQYKFIVPVLPATGPIEVVMV